MAAAAKEGHTLKRKKKKKGKKHNHQPNTQGEASLGDTQENNMACLHGRQIS